MHEIDGHLARRGPRKPCPKPRGQAAPRRGDGSLRGGGAEGLVVRTDYVPADEEAPRLTRDADGLPLLRLVDSGDRLPIWSPLDGGALLNPKGTGLRRFGLVVTYARDGKFHASAYRSADLRKGKPVELRREPDNPHDRNAVAPLRARSTKAVRLCAERASACNRTPHGRG